jgi:large subunit ribosomal protein L23
MHATTIIRRPIITEKSTESTERNQYAFEVDRRADKRQIREAVEELYKVRVKKVATMIRPGKSRRYRYGYAQSAPVKRAIVTVHPDDRIELF